MKAADAIVREVDSWEGVTQAPHRSGGVVLLYDRRELGRVHGDELVELPFAPGLRAMLVETGRADPHPLLPDAGRVTVRLDEPGDADAAIELFRLAYERARVAERVRAARRN